MVAPTAYAQGKLSTLLARWTGELGLQVQRVGPVVWPGIPPVALLALSANSTGATENTTDAVATQVFHEIGYYQTPAGPRDGPVPNPDPNAPHSAWARLAQSAQVRAALGRAGTTAPGAWRTAIADQAAIGIADYKGNAAAVRGTLEASLQGGMETQWSYALGCMGYSAGPSVATRVVRRFASALAGVPVAARFSALLYAAGRRAGELTRSDGHALVRAWQRLECGRVLAERLGLDAAWWALPVIPAEQRAELEATIDALYYGAAGAPAPLPPLGGYPPLVTTAAEPAPRSDAAATVGAGMALGGGLWLLWRLLSRT